MNSRESIYAALFTLVSGTTGIKTSGRRIRPWEEVSFSDQPALFQVQKSEEAKVVTHIPTVWTLKVDLVLYVNNSGQDSGPGAVAPMTIANPIVDAIVTALLPNPATSNEQTLGGLVIRCRIDGEIVTDEGALGNQAVVVIPVTLFAPQ